MLRLGLIISPGRLGDLTEQVLEVDGGRRGGDMDPFSLFTWGPNHVICHISTDILLLTTSVRPYHIWLALGALGGLPFQHLRIWKLRYPSLSASAPVTTLVWAIRWVSLPAES
jgi:hypothetical protein